MGLNWNSRDKFKREAELWDEDPRKRALAAAAGKAIIAHSEPLKNPLKTLNAFEFGCGTGLVSLEIAPLVTTLRAVDTSPEMLAVLQHKIRTAGVENIKTLSLDLLASGSPKDSGCDFGLIYGSMALHHIADTSSFLEKLSDLLAPGGTVAIVDLEEEDGTFHDDPLEKVHHGFNRAKLADMLKSAGLATIAFESVCTIEKANRDGKKASYPVFIVTARKPEIVCPT
ncbi:MAG: class I SAM-dependent methyltransferase [Chlorobiaceae bacterium]